MAECGTRVGGGTIVFPCLLESGHDGPCMAQENERSVSQRKRWERAQAEAPAQPPAEPGGGVVGSVVAPLPVASASGTRTCLACSGDRHGDCARVSQAGDGGFEICGCFAEAPDQHNFSAIDLPSELLADRQVCGACGGSGVQPSRGAFGAVYGDEGCAACGGQGWVMVSPPEDDYDPSAADAMAHLAAHPLEPTKQRPGDQPLPVKNDRPYVHDLLKEEVERRKQIGVERYGTPLQPFNGRNTLLDVLEELIDGSVYVMTAMTEASEVLDQALRVVAFATACQSHMDGVPLEDAQAVVLFLQRLVKRPG